MIWAHGGGALTGNAISDNGILSQIAIDNNLVIVNVEYRLAPEHKSPAGAQDCVTALKYLINNANEYGVDPNKIALGGVSGGGFTVMISSILLARNQEQSLVKKLILVSPMLGRNLDYVPIDQVPKWERNYV